MVNRRGNFSSFLQRRRAALGRKWGQILADAYLSRATLHRIRHGDPHQPVAEAGSLRALAHALKFGSWAELIDAYEREDVSFALDDSNALESGSSGLEEDALITLSKAFRLTPTELARRLAVNGGGVRLTETRSLPASIRERERRPARQVPHFLSGVAASRRVEKLEEHDGDSHQPAGTDDLRVFTIPVDGDCQEPVWKDGELVLFSFDAFDREGILPGKSYYLAFVDGSTTFKRVFLDPDHPGTYILRCWNATKYPHEQRVPFDDVVRVARAVAKQVCPEEEG